MKTAFTFKILTRVVAVVTLCSVVALVVPYTSVSGRVARWSVLMAAAALHCRTEASWNELCDFLRNPVAGLAELDA